MKTSKVTPKSEEGNALDDFMHEVGYMIMVLVYSVLWLDIYRLLPCF